MNMNMNMNLDNLLKQAQAVQSKMQSAQEELAKIVVTGEAGGGLVKIDMNGRHNVKAISINPTLLKDGDFTDKEEHKKYVEEILAAAFNNALEKVEKSSRQKLSDLTAQIQTKFSDDATEA